MESKNEAKISRFTISNALVDVYFLFMLHFVRFIRAVILTFAFPLSWWCFRLMSDEDEKPTHFITFKNSYGDNIAGRFMYKPQNKVTIIYSTPNGCDIDNAMIYKEVIEIAFSYNVNILIYSYPGYKFNRRSITGTRIYPTEQTVYENAEAAYRFVINKGIPAHSIIAMGYCIGSGTAVHLASNKSTPVGGLILLAPFLSLLSAPFGNFAKYFGPSVDMFNNENKINKVTCPVAILHGKKDYVIEDWQGVKLFNLASNAKTRVIRLMDNVDHMNITSRHIELILLNMIDSIEKTKKDE